MMQRGEHRVALSKAMIETKALLHSHRRALGRAMTEMTDAQSHREALKRARADAQSHRTALMAAKRAAAKMLPFLLKFMPKSSPSTK